MFISSLLWLCTPGNNPKHKHVSRIKGVTQHNDAKSLQDSQVEGGIPNYSGSPSVVNVLGKLKGILRSL
jgi:hypothetical protein